MNLSTHTLQNCSWNLQGAKSIAMPKAEGFGYRNDVPGVGKGE